METTLKQKLNHKITQKLIQSVNILQMNFHELHSFVEQISVENPFVVIDEDIEIPKNKEPLTDLNLNPIFDSPYIDYYTRDYNEDDNSFENIYIPHEETLCENILSQLLGGNYTKDEREIFFYIATGLDKNGYFPGGIEELLNVFNVEEEILTKCLKIMKNLDPKGVCAKDLVECLLIQLEGRNSCDIAREIIKYHLKLLGKNNLKKISELMHVDIKDVATAKDIIIKLNPKPSQGFSERNILKYITPDIVIVKFKEHFNIICNNFNPLNINFNYVNILKAGNPDKELLNYISKKIGELENIQKNIDKRNSTLLKLAEYILDLQKDFFLYGKGHLKPCKMKDASKSLNVSESTISRAVNGKYLQCCHGVFPLGYFFSKSCYTTGKSDYATMDSIKYMIKTIIDMENKKKPFSDQSIADILKGKGFDISRRTVTQYRNSLAISDCRIRRL